MGSRNTTINFTDEQGNTILNRGGVAIGSSAMADPTSIAVGAGAMGGAPALVPLLREMAAMLGAAGRVAAADMT